MPRFKAKLDSGPSGVDLDSMLHGVPVMALAGTLGRGCGDVHDIGIDAIASIMPIPMTSQEAAARLSPRAAW